MTEKLSLEEVGGAGKPKKLTGPAITNLRSDGDLGDKNRRLTATVCCVLEGSTKDKTDRNRYS